MTGRVLVVAPAAVGRAGWLVEAAVRRGLAVSATGVPGHTYYYGGPNHADRALGGLGVGLLEPPEDWLAGLPDSLTRRVVRLTTLGEARRGAGPVFAKPPVTKDFPARVYEDGHAIGAATLGLAADTPVLVSAIVEFAAEFRLFCLDGRVHAGSQYASWGRLDPLPLDGHPDRERVIAFAGDVLPTLPSAVVLDVGLVGPSAAPRRDVAVVEANMAWFAQPYLADTDRVLDVVLRAAGPLAEVGDADRRFLRRSGDQQWEHAQGLPEA